MGMATVFHPIFAARAVVITGAMISATTAGRMPINIRLITWLFFIVSGVRKIAINKIIKNEGRMVPRAAARLPRNPRSLSPTETEMFTAKMPGIDCATASRSRNSALSIQWFLSQISRSMIEIIAQPPPKVNAPIFTKVTNYFQQMLFIGVGFCLRHLPAVDVAFFVEIHQFCHCIFARTHCLGKFVGDAEGFQHLRAKGN